MCTHNLCFEQKLEKYHNFSSEIISFTAVTYQSMLNRRVFVMLSSLVKQGRESEL